jgi:alkaline phosphatase D
MSRLARLALPLTVASFLLLAPPAFAARGFSLGVTAGDVTASSAILWGKANQSGTYVLEVAEDRRFSRLVLERLVRARRGNDNTVQAEIEKLDPGTRHFFRFTGNRGRRSDIGLFTTAPRPNQNATIEFGWTGDTDFLPAPGQRRPFWNDGTIFRRMRAEGNDFNVHLGDTIYSDTEVPGPNDGPAAPTAVTVPQKWAKYRLNLGNRHLRALRRSGGLYSHWDDHEFINDFSPAEDTFANPISGISENISGPTLYRRGARAFLDYSPVTFSRRNGLYRAVRWGRNLELFFLDQRSFRSAKADEGGVCNNPDTGQPDVAPTAPQERRNFFAAVAPPLRQPVSQACLDAIRDPDRTFLGGRQLSRFLRDVERSTARFKVIINEMPIQQYYVLPYDRWEGYEAERQEVLRRLRDVNNVVFLTTDVHATLVNDASFQTLEPGGLQESGILEVTAGSAATANLQLEIDDVTGPGSGGLVDSFFFEPQPPDGVGMDCSIVDQFGYGQVRVTSRRLTITPKGINGRPQRSDDGPCGPFVLRYER